MKPIHVYGIKACDTMKKARTWLEAHGVAYEFHDYKSEGVAPETVSRWIGLVGWERVINRNGTTFRKLAEADRTDLDAKKALGLMVANPSMIKRPVVEGGDELVLGFSSEVYAKVFG